MFSEFSLDNEILSSSNSVEKVFSHSSGSVHGPSQKMEEINKYNMNFDRVLFPIEMINFEYLHFLFILIIDFFEAHDPD